MRGGDEGLPQGVLQLLIALQEDLLEDRELRGLCCPRLQPQEARRRGRGRVVGVWADLPEYLDGEEGVSDEGEPAKWGFSSPAVMVSAKEVEVMTVASLKS